MRIFQAICIFFVESGFSLFGLFKSGFVQSGWVFGATQCPIQKIIF